MGASLQRECLCIPRNGSANCDSESETKAHHQVIEENKIQINLRMMQKKSALYRVNTTSDWEKEEIDGLQNEIHDKLQQLHQEAVAQSEGGSPICAQHGFSSQDLVRCVGVMH